MEFSVIHGEEKVLSGGIQSDVDIVVADSPRKVVAQALGELRRNHLRPIIVNAYDAGGSASVYMATEGAEAGLQVDLYFDPRGVGRLGLRTGPILSSSVPGARWPIVSPECQVVYLLRKRHWKADRHSVSLLLAEASGTDGHRLDKVIQSIASPDVAESIHRLLNDDWHGFKSPVGNRAADLRRRADRIRHPVGFWIAATGSNSQQSADALAERFRPFVKAKVGKRPAQLLSQATWLAGDVAPIRWRPELFVSWSETTHKILKADLELSAEVGNAAHVVVSSMEARLRLSN